MAAGLLLAGGVAPADADHVTMPFQCKLDRGRVALLPGPERSYEIVGPRHQQPFLFCTARDDSRCRLRMLHRFEIACAGGRASWLVVAAAAARSAGREAFVDGGRLHLVIDGAGRSAGTECVDAPWLRPGARGPAPVGSFERPCWPGSGERTGPLVLSLPVGFAPLNEVGARLVLHPIRPAQFLPVSAPMPGADTSTLPVALETAATTGLPVSGAVAGVRAAAQPAAVPEALRPAIVRQRRPSPAIEVADAGADGGTTSPWIVTVRHDAEDGLASAGPRRGAASRELWLLVLLALSATLAAAGWYIRAGARQAAAAALLRRARSTALDLLARGRASVVGSGDPDERVLDDLRRTAEQLRSNADTVLDELISAPPLRGVLRQELDLIGQRLSDPPRAGTPVSSARQARQRLQAGIRELHRVVKIAEGAAASFSSGAPRPKMPSSRDEAYALLGVNDGVSEATLKKVVDALRMSWHPDHARDEDDRQRREERIKQINVAWDLIAERRLAS